MDYSNERFIQNSFNDFNTKVNMEEIKTKIFLLLENSLKYYESKIKPSETKSICSLLTKSRVDFRVGGNLVVYIKMIELSNLILNEKNDNFFLNIQKEKIFTRDYLSDAEIAFNALKPLFAKDLSTPKRLEISYYFSGAGISLYGTILYYLKGNTLKFNECLQTILKYKEVFMENKNKIYYEILYGVPGYLYILLELQSRFQFNEKISKDFKINIEDHVFEVVELIVNEGVQAFFQKKVDLNKIDLDKLPKDFRLVYTFHEKEYIGGAHGLFGVLSMLLQAYLINQNFFKKKSNFTNVFLVLVQLSFEYVVKLQMSSGNFPSSSKRKGNDLLVQFCHGSTGAVFPLILASKVCFDTKINLMENAIKAGENLWKYGLLKKGYGICHGISGNAYPLLTLFRAEMFALGKNDKYIMDVIENYDFEDRKTVGSSDFPFSLMQGLAGDICLLIDLLNPNEGRFPGYEII